MTDLVGFGLVNVDTVAVVPAWERDTKATATRWIEQIGGPVPVAMCAAARLGSIAPCFIGTVGCDAAGDFIASELAAYGVGAELARTPTSPTSRSMVMLDARDGSRTLANHPGSVGRRCFTREEQAIIAGARMVHCDARDLPATLDLVAMARAGGAKVSWDLGTMRPGREELFPLCDIVIASKGGGAGAFPDRPGAVDQVRGFLDAGCSIAAVTLAEQGVVIGSRTLGIRSVPAVPVTCPKDTCGAGDTFHGAFLAELLRGSDPIQAAEFACHAVAWRIQRYGHREGLPRRLDLDSSEA